MGLEIPDLDDKLYEELRTDARKRIPVHSDTWTNHNVSDPGITMLEMLAWIAETDIYELDRVTERHVRKYLRLLGVRPDEPRPATVSVTLSAENEIDLEPGSRLAVDTEQTIRQFETTQNIALTEASVAAVVSETPGGRIDNTRPNDTDGNYFLPFGPEAEESSAVYIGFDSNPFSENDQLHLFVDFHEANLPDPAEHGDEESSFDPSVTVSWEYCTNYEEFYNPTTWKPINQSGENGAPGQVQDGTDHLYHGGRIEIPEPADWDGQKHSLFDIGDEGPLYWLRARILTAGHEIPPQVNTFATNVVETVHARRHHDEQLIQVPAGTTVETAREMAAEGDPGTTSAQPGQEFAFPKAPVLAADEPRTRDPTAEDIQITVGGTEWEAIPDFDGSGSDHRAYVIDHERGVVRFGDGVRGEVPAPGQPVTATWYDHGGGAAGNGTADADWQFEDEQPDSWPDDIEPSDIDVRPRGPVAHGMDAESTDAALARLKADLRTPYRAVTAEDYRYLATHTPGLRFGRAAVHVEQHADAAGDCAPHGEVIVTIVPYSPRERPETSQGFREAVQSHLEQHRLLTDKLTVETPPYVPVAVEASIEIADGYAIDSTTSDVERALDQFLDPLNGFGGDGWPFGRPVYRSEIYETIEGIDGIDCVTDVDLTPRDPGTRSDSGIAVPPTALVYLDDVTVRTAGLETSCEGWSG